jgi:hypothetical protein
LLLGEEHLRFHRSLQLEAVVARKVNLVAVMDREVRLAQEEETEAALMQEVVQREVNHQYPALQHITVAVEVLLKVEREALAEAVMLVLVTDHPELTARQTVAEAVVEALRAMLRVVTLPTVAQVVLALSLSDTQVRLNIPEAQ